MARALQRFLTTTPTLNPALSLRVTPAPTPTPTVQVWFQNKRARERKALGPQASEHLRRRSTKDGTFPFRTLAVVQPGAEISLVEVLASEILALTRALTLILTLTLTHHPNQVLASSERTAGQGGASSPESTGPKSSSVNNVADPNPHPHPNAHAHPTPTPTPTLNPTPDPTPNLNPTPTPTPTRNPNPNPNPAPTPDQVKAARAQKLTDLFAKYVPVAMAQIRRSYKPLVPLAEFCMAATLCTFLDGLLTADNVGLKDAAHYELYFTFAAVWACGSALSVVGGTLF